MRDEDKTLTRARRTRRLIRPKPMPVTPESPVGSALAETAADRARFHFFLIDSGWDGPVPELVRRNLDMITQYQQDDPLFVLTPAQSRQMLKKHPHLIGKDPILLARDLRAGHLHGDEEYHGFHLNLGMIRDPAQALEVLKTFLNFLARHRQSADIEKNIREQLHRDGLQGAIEVLRNGSETLVAG